MSSQTSTLAPNPQLSESQIEKFIRDGYVVAPGLIPPDLAVEGRQAIWSALKIDPKQSETWPVNPVLAANDIYEQMRFCWTEPMDVVANQLAGPRFARSSGFVPVLNFPREGAQEFSVYGLHIDGINETTVWPVQRYLILLAYLSDTTEYGGALAVVPGSHRQVLEHWVQNGTGPGGSTKPPELNYQKPIPVAGKTGDVVFMHYLLVHASSTNHDDHIRVALNGTVRPEPVPTDYPKAGPPQPDWTPVDWTLRIDNLNA